MIPLSGSVKLLCDFSSGSPYARLYGRPPFGFRVCPGCRPRAASAARCAASKRACAARIAAKRSSRRRNSAGNSSPRTAGPNRTSSATSVSSAGLRKVSAWSTDTNGTQRGVDWQMKIDDARCKLKSVYPKNIM